MYAEIQFLRDINIVPYVIFKVKVFKVFSKLKCVLKFILSDINVKRNNYVESLRQPLLAQYLIRKTIIIDTSAELLQESYNSIAGRTSINLMAM